MTLGTQREGSLLSPSVIELQTTKWTEALATRKDQLEKVSARSCQAAEGAHTFETLRRAALVESTAGFLSRSMSWSRPNVNFFLGVLLEAINKCQIQENWKAFAQTLDESRQSLEKLDTSVGWVLGWDAIESNEQIRLKLIDAIVRVFSNLMDLWIITCSTIKLYPTAALEDKEPWKREREACLGNIRAAVSHFCDIAASISQAKQQDPTLTMTRLKLSADPCMTEDGEDRTSFPVKALPYPAYRGFFGRKELLAKIDKELAPEKISQPGPQYVKSVLLHGTGGVGKTQTALAYAHQNLAGFDAIFWIRSDLEANIQASLANITLALNLKGAKKDGDAKEDENLLYFTRWLGRQAATKYGKRWLIIFDNCEDIGDIWPKYIPKTSGSVLITSRSQSVKLQDSVIVPIKPFNATEGLKLMKILLKEKRRLLPTEENSLLTLFQKVDGLPLGIKVIVALMVPMIDRSSKYPITEFRTFFEQHSRELLTKVDRTTDYDRDEYRKVGEVHVLDNVWQLSFKRLDSEALSLLGMVSFMAAQDISISWFNLRNKRIPASQPVLSICTRPLELIWAIASLTKAALVNREDLENDQNGDESDSDADANFVIDSNDGKALDSDAESTTSLLEMGYGNSTAKFSVHRLVQDALIYSRSSQERQDIFDAAIYVISEAFPKQVNGETLDGKTETCSRLVPHVLSLASRYNELKDNGASPLVATDGLRNLLKSCIWYTYEKGEYKTALYLLKIAYTVYEDKETEVYADLQFKAGGIYLDQNDLVNCRTAWEDARDIYCRLKSSGQGSAKKALTWVLHSLGNLESADGNLDEAFAYFAEAAEQRRHEKPVQPWREGLAKMTLGRAYYLKGDCDTAIKNYVEAEEIFKESYASSTWMAYLKYAHGNAELTRGNLEEAKLNYVISQKCYIKSAPFHLAFSACYFKLGCIELQQQNQESALDHLSKALKIVKFNARGDQARILRKQAEAQAARGCSNLAAKCRKEAEETRLKISGQVGKNLDDTDAAWDSLVCMLWR
ncbi:hypothetical protein BP5796_10777 [Coleophoma crateriformis]|uniref:NB-ARC domain-containing protein n=1 Tax=Coleophoma crateriformis TaxID=565419 RepID=A0A3D8QR55_9HELO|nr:hypothetical protein BP5796_10777 [Coleophoma crateriformis]